MVVVSAVSDFLVISLVCVCDERALLPVAELVDAFEVLPVVSTFVVDDPSGFATVLFVDEELVWFKALPSELSEALVWVAVAV